MGYSAISNVSLYGRDGQPQMALSYYLRDAYDAGRLFNGYDGDAAELGIHLMNIHGLEYLSEEKENELFQQFLVNGSRHVKDLIIKAHLPFVIKIAEKIFFLSDGRVMLDDLIQAGNIGLIKAIDNFEMDRGVRFFVFAKIRIKTSIWREINATSRTVKLSRDVCERIYEMRNKFPHILWSSDDAPNFEDLKKDFVSKNIKENGLIPKHAYDQLVSGDKSPIVLTNDVEYDYLKNLGDYRYSGKIMRPDEVYIFKELCQQVESFLTELTSPQREIVERYLLKEETIMELAEDMPYVSTMLTKIVRNNRVQLKGVIESKTLETSSLEELLDLFLKTPSVPKTERTKENGYIDGDTRRKQVTEEIKRRLHHDSISLLNDEDLLRLIRFRDLIARQNLKLVKLIKVAEEFFYLRIGEIMRSLIDDRIIYYEKSGIFLSTENVLKQLCIVADEIVEKFYFESGMTISQYAEQCLFKLLDEKIKLGFEVPSFNILKVWKLCIKHESVDSIFGELKKCRCRVKGGWTTRSIKKTFTMKSGFAEGEEIFLGCLSVADLGFKDGALFGEVMARAIEMGLQICSQELGPYLALKYRSQPVGEIVHMAMYGISGSEYGQAIYRIGNNAKGRYITTVCIKPKNFVREGRRFVFIFPKKMFQLK